MLVAKLFRIFVRLEILNGSDAHPYSVGYITTKLPGSKEVKMAMQRTLVPGGKGGRKFVITFEC